MAKARPMLDELKKGPWPSFVKEIEKSAAKNEQVLEVMAAALSVVIPTALKNIRPLPNSTQSALTRPLVGSTILKTFVLCAISGKNTVPV